MKKTLLSAAAFAVVAVSAVAVAPTTSEAIPAFARQTGAACLSCHFQTFPQLTAFGRAFKRSAFTDVGEEALIEDDGLSIPATLNASLVLRAAYTNTKTNVPATATLPNPPAPGFSNGTWSLPIEAPLLIAGRVGANIGAFGEFVGGAAGANLSPTANWQVMSSFDFGSFKAGLNVFNTSFGFTAGIETSNVVGQHSGALDSLGNLTATHQLGFRNAVNTEGAVVWAGNELWQVQVGGVAPDTTMVAGVLAPANVGFHLAPMARVFVTPEVAGWDTGIGFGIVNGTVGAGNPVGGVKAAGMDMWFIDAQAQGEIGETSIGLYADYASTKAKTNTNVALNAYGAVPGAAATANADKADGWSLRATVKPLHNVILGAGYGQATYKPAGAGVTGGKKKAWQIAGTYEIYQNAELTLSYNDTKTDAAYGTGVAGAAVTTKTTTLLFEALM